MKPVWPGRTATVAKYGPLLLGAFWLWQGIDKLMDHRSFAATITKHGLLPHVDGFAWSVGGLEVAIGWLIVMAFARTGALAVLCAASLLTAYIVYLLQLSPALVAKTGCGCGWQPRTIPPHASLHFHIAANAVLIALHGLVAGAAWVSPKTSVKSADSQNAPPLASA